MIRLAWLCLGLSLTSCAPRPPHVFAPETSQALTLVMDPAPPRAEISRVLAGARGVYTLSRSGAFEASYSGGPRADLAGSTWVDAIEISALDDAGRWTLGLDQAGVVHRLRGAGGLEPMNARLGLPSSVRHIAAAGRALAALTDDGLFFVEKGRIARVALSGRGLAATRNVAAIVGENAIAVVDIGTQRVRKFAVESPRAVAFTSGDVLIVATSSALYRENGSGELSLRYVAESEIGALSTEGDLVWFADGRRIGLLDGESAKLTGEHVPAPITQITPTASDVWIVEGGRARRFARTGEGWPEDVERVVRQSCVPCHEAGGAGGLVLASPTGMRAHRAEVVRALATKAMPPVGTPISDRDRSVLLTWVRDAR